MIVDILEVEALGRALDSLSKNLTRRVYMRVGRKISRELVRLHHIATVNFERIVVPRMSVKATSNGMTVTSHTSDRLFYLLTVGAKPHTITARNAPMLAFPWGGRGSYVAKTVTGRLTTRAGSGRNVGPINYFGSVNHTGFDAREYHETIARRILPFAVKHMMNEVERALARL